MSVEKKVDFGGVLYGLVYQKDFKNALDQQDYGGARAILESIPTSSDPFANVERMQVLVCGYRALSDAYQEDLEGRSELEDVTEELEKLRRINKDVTEELEKLSITNEDITEKLETLYRPNEAFEQRMSQFR